MTFAQYADDFNYLNNSWLQYVSQHTDGSYLVLSKIDNATGINQMRRFDSSFNQIGTTLTYMDGFTDGYEYSTPFVSHFINASDFVLFGNIYSSTIEGTISSLSKHDAGSSTPLVDKRLVNTYAHNIIKGQTENYGLFIMENWNGLYNDGTGDFSIAYEPTLGGGYSQVVLLAYDDALNENWHMYFRTNPSSTYGVVGVDVNQFSNGDLMVKLKSWTTLDIDGTTYGQEDTLNYFTFRINPSTQSIIEPVLIANTFDKKHVYEDPYNLNTFYLKDDNSFYKLDAGWNIIAKSNFSASGADIFFTANEVVTARTHKSNTIFDIDVYQIVMSRFDKNLNAKYEQRINGNCFGSYSNSDGAADVKDFFLSFENNKLEHMQTYGSEYGTIDYIPEIDGNVLPEYSGGFHTVKYDFNSIDFTNDELIHAVQTTPITEVYNYVSYNNDGTLSESDSHVSYMVFPNGHDFSQYTLGSNVPTTWYQIPAGWSLNWQYPTVFKYDTDFNLYYFDVVAMNDSYIYSYNLTKMSILKVYMTDEQLSLSVPELEHDAISIFPNPANDYINIKSEIDINLVEIYSLQGQKIISYKKQNSIDVSNLSNGIYFLKVIDNSMRERIIKLIKN